MRSLHKPLARFEGQYAELHVGSAQPAIQSDNFVLAFEVSLVFFRKLRVGQVDKMVVLTFLTLFLQPHGGLCQTITTPPGTSGLPS